MSTPFGLKLPLNTVRRLRPLISPEFEFSMRRGLARTMRFPTGATPGHAIHTTVWKAGSQFVKLVLADPRLVREHGRLPFYIGEDRAACRRLTERFAGSLQLAGYIAPGDVSAAGTGASGTSSGHTISGAAKPKVAFVWRDPRTAIVSYFWSAAVGHPRSGGGNVEAERPLFAGLSPADGLALAIERYEPSLDLIEQWLASDLDTLHIFRLEDLTDEDRAIDTFEQLCRHLELDVRRSTLASALRSYSLERLARSAKYRGSQRGEFDQVADGELTETLDRRLATIHRLSGERTGPAT